MITPLLSMSLPDPGVTPGPQYANLYNAAMLYLDGIVGAGTTPAQMNINSYLDFQGNDAVNLRTVRLFYTGTLSAPTDVNCLYNLSGNLYFIDNAGNQIRITNNGALNTGVSGNIGGLAGNSASLSYNSVQNLFTFNAAPSTLASINAMTGVFGAVVCSGTLTAAVASFTSASYGNIQTLTGSLVQATTVSGGTGNFGTSNITTLTNATLNGTNANFTQLTSSGGKVTTLTATNGTVTTLTATNATITNGTVTTLTSSGATLGPVTATTINGTSTLTAPTATITTGNITTANVTTATLTNITSAGTSTLTTISGSTLQVQNATTLSGTLNVGASKVVITPSSTTAMISASGDIIAAGGFKQQVGAFVYSGSSETAGFLNLLYCPCMGPAGSAVSEPYRWVASSAGSIVGMSVYVNRNGSNLGTATVYQAYVNANPTAASLNLGLVGSAAKTYAKDAVTFSAGDQVEILFSGSGAVPSSYVIMLWLTVEM